MNFIHSGSGSAGAGGRPSDGEGERSCASVRWLNRGTHGRREGDRHPKQLVGLRKERHEDRRRPAHPQNHTLRHHPAQRDLFSTSFRTNAPRFGPSASLDDDDVIVGLGFLDVRDSQDLDPLLRRLRF